MPARHWRLAEWRFSSDWQKEPRTLRRAGPDQRIDDPQFWKSAEIAVGRKQFAHAVAPAKGDNPRIMDPRADDARVGEQCAQPGPVRLRLGQQPQGRRLHPGVDLLERAWERRRRRVDAGMGCDRQEFMPAGPGNRPI